MEHQLLRRAMWIDLNRLGSLASVDTDELRSAAMHQYLDDLCGVFDSQNRFVHEVLWPLLSAASGSARRLPYAADLARAELAVHAALPSAGDEFASRLVEAAHLLSAVLSGEQLHLLPLLETNVGPVARAQLQVRFRHQLPAGMLAFLVPWAMRHADNEEMQRLLACDAPAIGVALKMYGPRFAKREQLVFESRRTPWVG
jgi:hypothetical protein